MNKKNKETFDVAVIGGGPAGMMAAIRSGECGASTILLEKNKNLGQKLLLTGGGRCNITNAEFDVKKLTAKYGKNGKFLFSAFNYFGPQETISFFKKNNLLVKTERGGRVFPKTNKATSVLRKLKQCLKKNQVLSLKDTKVHRLSVKEGYIKKIILQNKQEIFAKNIIIATGGLSYPLTGSTGDGLRWAKNINHNISQTSPALVPLKLKENWAKELQGLSLKNVELTATQDRQKIRRFGECLFTHFGISGPIVLDMSKEIGEMLKKGDVKLSLDTKPALDIKKLDKRITSDFQKYSNKLFKNSLEDLLPKKLIPVVVSLSKINPNKKTNKITKEERRKLVLLLKNIEMNVKELQDYNYAIVTSGGVNLSEIDQKTMQSKKINNLFFAGEVIDIDGPTGGFNLQVCWSTGYVAGESAAKNKQK